MERKKTQKSQHNIKGEKNFKGLNRSDFKGHYKSYRNQDNMVLVKEQIN